MLTRPDRANPARHAPDDRSDEQLAGAAASGDRQAFAVLVDRFHGRLFGYIAQRVRRRSDAEDLTQEAFVRAWRHIDRFDDQYRFSTWIYTISYRLVVGHYRKRRSMLGISSHADTLPDGSDSPEHDTEVRDEVENVWHTARQILATDQYDALWLRYGEEMDTADIAAVMQKKPGHIRVLLHRARQTLAERLSSKSASPDTPPTAPAGVLRPRTT